MLKVEVKGGHAMGLHVSGDLEEIAMDIYCLLDAIHCTLLRANPDAAKEFKTLVQWTVADGSPVWAGQGEIVGGSARLITMTPKGRGNGNGSV